MGFCDTGAARALALVFGVALLLWPIAAPAVFAGRGQIDDSWTSPA